MEVTLDTIIICKNHNKCSYTNFCGYHSKGVTVHHFYIEKYIRAFPNAETDLQIKEAAENAAKTLNRKGELSFNCQYEGVSEMEVFNI